MKKQYEIVCTECGATFFSEDEEAMYCEECWKRIMHDFFESIKYERFDV